jgi:hypothetical protein
LPLDNDQLAVATTFIPRRRFSILAEVDEHLPCNIDTDIVLCWKCPIATTDAIPATATAGATSTATAVATRLASFARFACLLADLASQPPPQTYSFPRCSSTHLATAAAAAAAASTATAVATCLACLLAGLASQSPPQTHSFPRGSSTNATKTRLATRTSTFLSACSGASFCGAA